MKYTPFQEQRFRASVTKALQQVKSILDTTRHFRLAEDEEHTYPDKFALCEFLTNTAIASHLNALENLGLDTTKLQIVSEWVHGNSSTSGGGRSSSSTSSSESTKGQRVTLRFQSHDSCVFLKEQDVEIVTEHHRPSVDTTSASQTTLVQTSAPTTPGWLGGGSLLKTTETTTTTNNHKARVVTKIKEYHWKVEVGYKILLFPGLDPHSTGRTVELISRTSSTIIITSGGQQPGQPHKPPTPLPEHTEHPIIDTDLTWLIQMISPKDHVCQFAIDRRLGNSPSSDPKAKPTTTCKTPRRNDDVDAAFAFNQKLYQWAQQTQTFFLGRVEQVILKQHNPVQAPPSDSSSLTPPQPQSIVPGTRAVIVGLQKEPTFNGKVVTICEFSREQQRFRVEPVDATAPNGLPPTMLIKPQNVKIDTSQGLSFQSALATADSIFVPIVPLFENQTVLPIGDVVELLAEHSRSLDTAMDTISKLYPPRQLVKLVSMAEASIVLLCYHLMQLAEAYQDAVDYVEHLLKTQLVAAIGREIESKDLDEFMTYYHHKVLGPTYAPRPCTYAIRRPNHDPDGTFSIEHVKRKEPIPTMVRCLPSVSGHGDGSTSSSSLFLPISATTTVEITGDRYLHGWIQTRFKSKPTNEFHIVARARQFSSFLLILGTIAGPNQFEPKDAIILQNKDEVLIPLLTTTLPSAKDFRDSIASLSPEQQSFAKAFRSMQLESSVFGLCIIQLKPQLEKLLGLQSGSLTKEIQLTQDLMSLFVDYQIPSDLLTFDGASNSDVSTKVANVKEHVKSVLQVIEYEKEKQLKEEERKADMRAELNFNGMPHPPHVNYDGAGAEGEAPSAIMEDALPSGGGTPRRRMMAMAKASAPPQAMAFMAASSPLAPPASASSMKASDGSLRRQSSGSSSINWKQQAAQSFAKQEAYAFESQDFTAIPRILDNKMEKLDSDNSIQSTIIKTGRTWTRKRQQNLLTPPNTSQLFAKQIDDEKKKAFDLLDAVSRSGVLPIEFSELHVVVAVSHCFENDLMGTIIQDNVNPIDKLEKSTLMIASTIYGKPTRALIEEEAQVKRLESSFPQLFAADAN